jgi:hypothetical protein
MLEEGDMRQFFWILVVTVGLAGCATGPSRLEQFQSKKAMEAAQKQTWLAQAQNEDCGPLPKNWQAQAKAHIARQLKDSDSAKFNFNLRTPIKGYIRWNKGPDGNYPLFCWVAFCGVNAKNSFGGYTGESLWWIAIRDGKVFDAYSASPELPSPEYEGKLW